MRAAWILFIALLLGPSRVGAQAAEHGPRQPLSIAEIGLPTLHVYGEADGLPSPKVYAAAWGPQGRLWIGTQGGVATFDGRTWTTIPFPPGAKSQTVRAILCAADGSQWFGTQNDGLYHLKDGAWSRVGADSGLPSDWVNTLLETRDASGGSVLWVGTDAGLAHLEQGRWRMDLEKGGPQRAWIWEIALRHDVEARTSLWVATRDGIFAGGPGAWSRIGAEQGLPSSDVSAILEREDGQGGWEAWAACWGGGLARAEGGRWRAVEDFPSRYPVSLATTREPGRPPILWAGTYDIGLAWREAGAWRRLDLEQGLPSRGVYTLLPSPGGRPTLWLGTQTGGLASLDLHGWASFGVAQGLPDPSVTAIAETMEGDEPVMWFGTSGGLAHFAKGRWSIEAVREGLPSGQVNAVLPGVGSNGRPGLWVATLKGLALRQDGRWTTFARQRGPLAEQPVNCVLQTRDAKGKTTLWAGTGTGLDRFRDGAWSRLTTEDGLAGNWTSVLLETTGPGSARSLWAGSRGGGLARLQGGRWTRMGAAEGLPPGPINALFETHGPDDRHWLWVGTLGGGLGRLDLNAADARFEILDSRAAPALPDDDVLRLEQDRQGRLYLTTHKGVVRLSLHDLGAPLSTAELEAYGRQDGLPSRFCALGASTVDHLGRIWVGTMQGAAMMDPNRETPPAELPRLLMLHTLVNGRDAGDGPELALRPGERRIAFEYLLPGFDHPLDVRYRTQVIGLEEAPAAWTPEGRRELTALSPGKYTFRIWAMDHLGRETRPVDVRFEVRPPVWRSPLAILVYGVALALTLFTLHRVRLRLLRDHARRLEREVARATEEIRAQQKALAHFNDQLSLLNEQKSRMLGIAAHDLRNPLQSIFSMAELLELGESTPEELARTTQRIQEAAEEMAQLIRKLLDVSAIEDGSLNLRLEAVDAQELARSVVENEAPRARAKGMAIELILEGPGPLLRADRFYLREVLLNLVGNAVKFTPPGPPERRIRLRLWTEPGWGVLEVQDEGPGFSAEDRQLLFGRFARLSARPTAGERSTGLGLSIVKALVETMGGTIELADLPAPGATFRLRLPLHEAAQESGAS